MNDDSATLTQVHRREVVGRRADGSVILGDREPVGED